MIFIGNGGHAKVVRELIYAAGLGYDDSWAVIAVGDNADRKKEALLCKFGFDAYVHPSAIVSPTAKIGIGTVVMAGVIVQAGARIGKHCILNSGCAVDHDCVIGDYVHIAPGAHLCGTVTVGEGAMVGVGVGVPPNVTIPAWSLVKAARLDIWPSRSAVTMTNPDAKIQIPTPITSIRQPGEPS